MKVTLIDFTGAGFNDPAAHAAALLVFTKNTRLEMSAGGLAKYLSKPMMELLEELEYMANTIPSSWEFVDYTFMIEGVTRAFTHQLVRTRTASFAQQTMRVLNVSEGNEMGWTFGAGPSIAKNPALNMAYGAAMKSIDGNYKSLIKHGAEIEDARGILPTNIHTNIVAKMNMRTWVELIRKRSSPRTQGEYRSVLDAMAEEVRTVHPWIDLFINRTFDRAAKELDLTIKSLVDHRQIAPEMGTAMIKLVDQMRGKS